MVGMKRLYEKLFEEHLEGHRQMLFLSGPRQVGKTTTSLRVAEEAPTRHIYLNWDDLQHRTIIAAGSQSVADHIGLQKASGKAPRIVFDELHKYRRWKTFLKGFFDLWGGRVKILVTGSSRLDVYRRGGDSMMGRYFLYRLHPLSIAEIVTPVPSAKEIRKASRIREEDFQALLQFGGFPEPYLQRSSRFYEKWKRLRLQQLFREDLRELTRIQEFGQMELLAEYIMRQAAQLTSFASLAKHVGVSESTIKRWVGTLQSFYFCYTIQPWTKNVMRSLLKEPKIYLWDWALVDDIGARLENLVASHLLKAVHFWTDSGLGAYQLYFIRDKDQREVDFLVTKNRKPWFLVEVKKSDHKGLSPALYRFQKQTGAQHAFQVAFDMPYEALDCFQYREPVIVPATTFLAQLV
jgi:uncharacterized protein